MDEVKTLLDVSNVINGINQLVRSLNTNTKGVTRCLRNAMDEIDEVVKGIEV